MEQSRISIRPSSSIPITPSPTETGEMPSERKATSMEPLPTSIGPLNSE